MCAGVFWRDHGDIDINALPRAYRLVADQGKERADVGGEARARQLVRGEPESLAGSSYPGEHPSGGAFPSRSQRRGSCHDATFSRVGRVKGLLRPEQDLPSG